MIDPDTYPLVYMGCRDNKWRIIAIDRDEPTELFNLNADELPNQIWNDDWDSSVVIRNDYAFVGGENSHFYILKLNRGYNAEGKVTVDPEIVLDHPAWTQSLLDKLGSKDVSVENSPCLVGDRVYFSNSGGLVQGLDVSATLKELAPGEEPAKGQEAYPKVFSYWTGDDTDATIVADEQGFIYVCQHSDDARRHERPRREGGPDHQARPAQDRRGSDAPGLVGGRSRRCRAGSPGCGPPPPSTRTCCTCPPMAAPSSASTARRAR